MYLSLDIGGSAIKTAIVDKDFNIVERGILSIDKSFEEMIKSIKTEYDRYNSKYDIIGLGISAPGAVDSTSGIIYGSSAIDYIHGPNFKEILKQELEINVEIVNDANSAALAEAHVGDYADSKSLSLVILGSGVGGANVLDGKIIEGSNLHGGEFGYVILGNESDSVQSMSMLASVGGIIRQANNRGLNVTNGIELFELYESCDIAKEIIDKFYKYLAIGIFNIQYTFDPELILIGGAISKREELLDKINENLDKLLASHDSAKITPTLKIATYGNDSNIIGAIINYKLRRENFND